MTARLLTAAACVVLSLLCVWIVDPDNRSAAYMAKGAVWGFAGILVVGLIRFFIDRRAAAASTPDRAAQ